jgi:hypothetical protein
LLIKKIKYLIIFVLLILVGGNNEVFAQPGNPGGGGGIPGGFPGGGGVFPGGGGRPGCWPPSTCETPINNELIILLIAGLVFAFYYVKRNNIASENGV